MNNKRTITTREQIKINGEIRERTATHIVTGAHGYETLCISGYCSGQVILATVLQ